MLVQFSVANYLSFENRETLSLVASGDALLREQNTFTCEASSDLRLLKSVGVYGANASGKSNLVGALSFMRRFVLESDRDGQRDKPIEVKPFKLNPAKADQPSEFEVVFVAGGQRYAYGFTADRERVHEEWLTATQHRTKELFRRSGDDIRFGQSWRGERSRLARLTRPNALFLSVAVQFNNRIAQPVFDWFSDDLRTISPEPFGSDEIAFTIGAVADRPDLAEAVRAFLRVADLGISDVKVEETHLSREQLLGALREDGVPADAVGKVADHLLSRSPDPSHAVRQQVVSTHNGRDGFSAVFEFPEEESDGTARLFLLLGPWLFTATHGCVLLVDELDTKLHPLLTRLLVQMIHIAPKPAQLVFATYDCGLLDAELFRRDQIWFTEKDSGGATHLYSLWEYRPRRGENLRKGYLTGRYGAIPFFGEFSFGEKG